MDDKPTKTEYYESGQIEYQVWRKKGLCHREGDKPAYESYYESGQIEYQVWRKDGLCHREGDKPAYESYYENGQIKYQEWCKDGLCHREGDKPAYESYYENGQIEEQVWRKDGLCHREGDKLAFKSYYKDGKIKEQKWHKWGIPVTEDFAKNWRKILSPEIILKEENIQKRMMYIRLYGMDNLLAKLKHSVLDISQDKQYELLQFDNIFSVPMKVLKMRCPSTRVYYFAPVEPKCKNVREALLYYYKEKEYEFVVET